MLALLHLPLQQLARVGELWEDYQDTIADYLANPQEEPLQRLQAESPVILKEMNIGVRMMAAAANESVRVQQLVALLLSLGILLIALVSGFCGMPWLMAQINSLAGHLSKVKNGDFSSPMKVECSDNEVGEMVSAYNEMLVQVGGLVDSTKHLSQKITRVTGQLMQVADSSEAGSSLQNSELDQVSTAMNEMTATVNEVAGHASVAAEAANDASGSADQGH